MATSYFIFLAFNVILGKQCDLKSNNLKGSEAFAYMPDSSKPVLCLFVDQLPRYNGGENKLHEFFKNNTKWPNEFGNTGTVLTSFIVEKNGKVSNIKIERKLCPSCDEEAKRLIIQMPAWIPGKVKGKVERVHLYLPIRFELTE